MYRAFGKSDTGRVRKSNQDVYCIRPLADDALFALVCDGMGGESGGHIASKIAMEVLEESVAKNYSPQLDGTQIERMLSTAMHAANARIQRTAQENIEYHGMGTTATAGLFHGETLYIAHAGDSRLYLMREGEIQQLTTDHSVVQMLVDRGDLTAEEARTHPQKNYITRAVGVLPEMEADLHSIKLREGDLILICSDGFSNYFSSDEMQQLLTESHPDRDIAGRLVEAANQLGGSDNITVVVVEKLHRTVNTLNTR